MLDYFEDKSAVILKGTASVFERVKTFDIPYDDNLREALRHMQKNFLKMNDDEKDCNKNKKVRKKK